VSRAKTPSKIRAQGRKSQNAQASPRPGSFSAKNLTIVLSVLLGSVTIALYSPVIGHSFVVFDDRDYITANPYVHGGLSWSTIKWAFTATAAANWHPLTWLSHALDYQLFALNPAGHHLVSLLIHALNAVLLFLLLRWITQRMGPSLLVAALFALHPINVESVAWVAERKNLLSTFFFFLDIGAYAWYAQKPDWRRYLLVVALFAAGLMAKPMVITLPFVLLLLDYWPLERTPRDRSHAVLSSADAPQRAWSVLLMEKLPLLLLSAASAWITLKAQRGAVRGFEAFPIPVRIENAIVAYGMYLWKMLWPARLAFYQHSVIDLPAWQWILSASILVAITALVVILRRKRYLPVGWFWFLGTLVPVIGLVQVGEASMADRYAYISLIGIFIMVAWGLDDLVATRRITPAWRLIPALCVLAALSFVTSRQLSYWTSEYDVWSHTVAITDDPFAHNAVGAALLNPDAAMTRQDLEEFDTEQKRIDEARRHFERGLEIRSRLAQQDPQRYLPYLAGSLNNLGTLDRDQNRTDEARQHLEGALKIYRQIAQQNPDAYLYYLASTLNNLGQVDRMQNRPDDARLHYEEALTSYRQLAQRDPEAYSLDMATVLNNLGNLDGRANRLDEARQHYEEALQSYPQPTQQNPLVYLPDMATTLSNLANVNRLQNRMDEARGHYEAVLKIYRQLAQREPGKYLPYVAGSLDNLGSVDRSLNRIELSRADYQEALIVLQRLVQVDNRYAGDVARVEASLDELAKKEPSQ
jgi:protein O-mannosyl-transferase